MLAFPWIDFDFEHTFFCLVFNNHMIEECFECSRFLEFDITKLALIPFDILSEAFSFQIIEFFTQVLVVVFLQNIFCHKLQFAHIAREFQIRVFDFFIQELFIIPVSLFYVLFQVTGASASFVTQFTFCLTTSVMLKSVVQKDAFFDKLLWAHAATVLQVRLFQFLQNKRFIIFVNAVNVSLKST